MIAGREVSQQPRGLHGRVALTFARRGSRTVLAHARLEAPMAMIRPFERPDGRLVVPLITLGPGFCSGDAVTIDVCAEPGARVVVTTTAASRIMSMRSGEHAEQHVTLRAGDGAMLEYYPSVTIPFPGSALTQTVHVEAAATARIGVLETWALGRVARGEYLQFRRLSSRTTMSVDEALRYADATHLEPAASDLTGAGILAGSRYLASGFWYGATLADGATPADGATLPARADEEDGKEGVLVAFGQSRPDLVYLRALGLDGPALGAALRRAVDRVAAGWALPPLSLDRFTC